MIEAVRSFVDNLGQTLRFADFVDIALVAIFLYLFISWMRQSTSTGMLRRLVVMFLAFIAVYLPARIFDMFLVGRMAEVLFFALIIALVLLFQSDLRRMLDRAGTWIFSGGSDGSDESPADVLTVAVSNMADEKTGALIAIRGMEPWERHIRGGVNLGGEVSPPLLYSIFDHRTPGHDGALLMEGDRIVKFAAHLPLADGDTEMSKYGGTRHAAALGLSERCDAFVIVVSEERGTISVARDGTIEEVGSSGELKSMIEAFWDECYGEESSRGGALVGKHSLQTAAMSIASAVALWLIFAYSPEIVYRNFEVPIEYRNVPLEWTIEGEERWANVTLTGPEQAFRLIDAERLTITLNLEEPEEGVNEFTIGRDELDLPSRLLIEDVQPQTVQIVARPMQRLTLPVTVPTEGALPEPLRLVGIETEPDSISVLVLENGEVHSQISTEPVDLSEISEETTLQRSLVLAPNMRFRPEGETEVEVFVEVEDDEQDEEDS